MSLRSYKNILLYLAGILLLSVVPAQAQDGDWEYTIITYFWGAGLDGDIAAAGRSVQVDQSAGEILENLEFGFSGGVRAYNGRWAVTSDFMYIGLGATVQPAVNPIEVDVDQWMIAGDVGYQVATNVEVLGGVRIVNLQNKLQFTGPLAVEAQAEKTWVDPVVGFRFAPRFSESWQLWIRFDLGGFDVGSDFTWQLNANLVWHATESIALTGGYRVIDIKYDDEDGDQEFVYDATSHGPIIGLAFSL